jgi:hypothetical protein
MIQSYELQSTHVTLNTTVCRLEKEIGKLLTSLLGTQIGVPSLTTPASIITPITIGSRELKMNCKARNTRVQMRGERVVTNQQNNEVSKRR